MNEMKTTLSNAMKAAMKAKEKDRLTVIRGLQAAIKQVEIDDQVTLDDAGVLAVLDKQIKQRKDSIVQFAAADRDDLVEQEQFQLEVIQGFMPEPLSDAEVKAIVDAAIAEVGANGMQDMGKVMNLVRPQVQGRGDMGQISAQVKQALMSL